MGTPLGQLCPVRVARRAKPESEAVIVTLDKALQSVGQEWERVNPGAEPGPSSHLLSGTCVHTNAHSLTPMFTHTDTNIQAHTCPQTYTNTHAHTY